MTGPRIDPLDSALAAIRARQQPMAGGSSTTAVARPAPVSAPAPVAPRAGPSLGGALADFGRRGVQDYILGPLLNGSVIPGTHPDLSRVGRATAPAGGVDSAAGVVAAPGAVPVNDPGAATRARVAGERWSRRPTGEPGIGTKVLGTLASLGRDIPFVEPLQAGTRALVRGESYADALRNIRGVEDAAPGYATWPARIAGGTVAALTLPKIPGIAAGGATRQAAQYGILKGLGSADPGLDIAGRIHEGAKEGTVSALAAKVLGPIAMLGRTLAAKTLGTTAQNIDKRITAATVENYGKAAAEGQAAGGTSPAIVSALEHPRVKPFVDLVRGGEGSTKSDADVAREAYKLMSKQRRGLKSFMERNGYDAAKDIEATRLGDAMKQLKDATAAASEKPPITMDVPPDVVETAPRVTPGREPMAGPVANTPLAGYTTPPSDPTLRQALRDFPQPAIPPTMKGPGGPQFQLRGQPDVVRPGVRIETPGMRVQTAPAEAVPPAMPSFPKAVAEKARMEGERVAFQDAADAAKRIMQGSSVAGNKLLTKSPEAFRAAIAKMSPGDATAATQGLFGRAREALRLSPNPLTGFGIGRGFSQINRLSPFADALDARTGVTLSKALRATGAVSAADPFSSVRLPVDVVSPQERERSRKAAAIHK